MSGLRWDIFCRVIDNFGDVGVCWRLASQLAVAGETVRLIADDASALAWMAPAPRAPVAVLPWPGPADAAQVVIEAFGCDPPAAYAQAMLAADPVWINLEYLSAESYVERSHGLPSPQASGLRKWFFYPGFTPATGGLLREPGLKARREAFDARSWLASRGLAARPGERVVSLFGYPNEALPQLLHALGEQPTLLLLAQGPAQQQALALRHRHRWPEAPRAEPLPWLTLTDYDHLLWSCDLNFVRGEDSLVRALWAGAPLVWQAYPQDDGAHAAKVQALLAQLDLPADAAALWRAWNGMGAWSGLPRPGPWAAAAAAASARLHAQPDLLTRLRAFVAARLAGSAPADPGLSR